MYFPLCLTLSLIYILTLQRRSGVRPKKIPLRNMMNVTKTVEPQTPIQKINANKTNMFENIADMVKIVIIIIVVEIHFFSFFVSEGKLLKKGKSFKSPSS